MRERAYINADGSFRHEILAEHFPFIGFVDGRDPKRLLE